MVAAVALAGIGWVASPIVTKLLNEGFSYLDDRGCSCLKSGVKDRLENLETTILPQFQLVIEAAENSVHRTKVEQWLTKLKNALYETEDVLDLFKYQLLKEKVSDLNTHPALKPLKNVARKVNTKLSILSSKKAQLRRSLNKLEMIAAEAKTFREHLGMPIGDGTVGHELRSIGGNPSVTTSQLKDEVFGRNEEREEIVKHLLNPSEASRTRKRYSVVAIVGIGGAGKTTLAQFVYNDQRVIDHFEIKMWICVSRRLDVFKHTREMINSVTKKECPRIENLDTLQTMLTNEIKSKKVLLVLDDVWCNKKPNEVEWENLLAPLSNIMSGSKILVTTRTSNLSVALHPQFSMSLRELEEDVIVSLFMYHAFGGNKVSDLHLKMELENIGKQIARKLHKSPLAAKAVGGQLSTELKPEVWRDALKRDNLGDSQQALLWSYQRLDTPLQRCFSYLSLFPKGTSYQVKEMIHLWIAEGFINSSNDGRSMEDIGKDYFNELVRGSFLQLVKDGYKTNYYNMHDLFHDLVEKISKEDCLRIEDNEVKEIPPTIRHLSIWDESMKESDMSFKKLENLRTLIVKGSHSSPAINNLFAAIEKYKKLRVLILYDVSRKKFTKLIADLKHMRFLDFIWSKEDELSEKDELPATLGKLYHLQVLDPPNDAILPRNLKNLINLRHFRGDDTALTALPGIGRLTSLQTDVSFVVKLKKKGYDIGQLKNLNELRQSLTISNLEKIKGKDKAIEASLKDKRHLMNLFLEWDNDNYESECRRELDLEVLEGLKPHPELISLSIFGYQSPRFPTWLLQKGCLENLKSLRLHNCTTLAVLPPVSDLFPYCQALEIWSLPNLRTFPLLPQSLKVLVVSECPSLVFFSKEEKIELVLPSLLQELKIRSCNITNEDLPQFLERVASLKYLTLYGISTITTLPSEEVLQHLIALTELQIFNCSRLESLGGLHALPSLEELRINGCPSLELEMVALGSLRSLYIEGCTKMKSFKVARDLPKLNTISLISIPSLETLSVSCLSALSTLRICECPLLSSLPSNLPESLEYLCLDSCSAISALSDLPKSIATLVLKDCPSILSLPEHLPESLRSLVLWNCPGISSLPGLPEPLKDIEIVGCPLLEEQRQVSNGEGYPDK